MQLSYSARCAYLAPLLFVLLSACRRSDFPEHPDGYREFAYVANTASNSVTVLDLVYLRLDRTLSVGNAPVALAASPTRAEVYVLNAQPDQPAGSVSVIDTQRNAVVATIPVHHAPAAISVESTGHRAFVANTGSNTISVLDLDTRRQLASIATSERPTGMIVSPDGRSLLVTRRTGSMVSIFSVAAPNVAGPALSLRATISGCPGATDAVILPDSSKAFVACSTAEHVLAIGLAAAPGSWAVRQDASLAYDHALALLQVGHGPTQIALKPDGGEIFVSNSLSDSVSEISTQTNEVGSTYEIGNRPDHGVVSADNGALWVANSGADSLSLYSIDDGKMVSSLRTGNGPGALAFSADQHLLLAADARSGDVAVIRTNGRLGPALFTLLPAGSSPSAIVVKAMEAKP